MSELRRELQINGVTYHLAVNQHGKGAPTASTPGKPAVLYMDEDTGDLYKCTAADVAAGVYTWEPLGSNDSGGNVVQGSGLSATAKALLIAILRNGVFVSDQSASITALENALASGDSGSGDTGDTETVTYTITNKLTNCSNSNTAATIAKNSAYTAVITAVDGYELDSVVVTMGGVAVAVTDGVIIISSVTGNIVITATAVEASTGGSDTNTDNLIDFNGDTIIESDTGTATVLDDHSVIVAGGSVSVIVNGLSPGSQYSFNYDGGNGFSIYGSIIDDITASPETANLVQIKANGTLSESDRPYVFTMPNTCRALLITIYNGTWTNMVLKKQVNPLEGSPYELTFIENEYVDNTTGAIQAYDGWNRTDYTSCHGVSQLRTYFAGSGKDSKYNAFYDESKNFISAFQAIKDSPITVPDNAHYFVFSGEAASMDALVVIPIAKEV